MKTQLLSLLASMFIGSVGAQNLSLSWVRQFGGPSAITPLGSTTDPSGSIITCGTIEGVTDFDPGPESNPASTNGLKDAYISKLNSSGEYVWSVAFGGTGNDFAYDIAVDVSGNIYCTGEFAGTVNFNPSGTAANLTAFNGYNAFIVKYSASGQFQWVKKFGGASSGYESGRNIAIDATGNIISCGKFYGLVDFDPNAGVAELGSSSTSGAYISKLTSNGEYVWAKFIPGTYTTPTELNIDNNNNIFCVGYFYGATDFDPSNANFSLTGQYYDTYIAKYSPQGNFVWVKQLTSANYCYTNALRFASDGSIYLAGGFNGTTDFDPDLVSTQTVTNTTGTYRPFLLKLSATGLFQYLRQLAPNSTGTATGLQIDNSGNLYITGSFKGTSDFNPDPVDEYPMTSNGLYYDDAFITKLNPDGSFNSAYSFGGTNNDYIDGLLMNPSNGVLTILGTFNGTCDFDPSASNLNLTSSGGSDGYIARFVQCTAVAQTIQETACGSYDFNGTIYTESGSYNQLLSSSLGCDSLVTLELTVSGATFSNVNLYTTDVITFNNETYNAAGQYTQTIQNAAGCDSIIYIEVFILENNFELENNDGVLSGNQPGSSYQWVDCSNNNEPIAGATQSTFTPTTSGNYALIVYGTAGEVMSECLTVTVTSVDLVSSLVALAMPNPCNEWITLKVNPTEFQSFRMLDLQGRIVHQGNIQEIQTPINLNHLDAGMYYLQCIGNHNKTISIVKQ